MRYYAFGLQIVKWWAIATVLLLLTLKGQGW